MSACRSCGAPIKWATSWNGPPIPLDPVPREDGNIHLDHGRAVVVHRFDGDELGAMFVSHFATCPHADQWRRPRATP